jgi:hypothetical protein
MFQIFGNIFRCWVAMELPCEMHPKSKLVEIDGRCFLGSAFILFNIAVYGTHWIGPEIWLSLFYEYGKERVQYRTLRVVLGLMGSTPNNCVGVLSGMSPLPEIFASLNFRYL